jgi:hypothetical protein
MTYEDLHLVAFYPDGKQKYVCDLKGINISEKELSDSLTQKFFISLKENLEKGISSIPDLFLSKSEVIETLSNNFFLYKLESGNWYLSIYVREEVKGVTLRNAVHLHLCKEIKTVEYQIL